MMMSTIFQGNKFSRLSFSTLSRCISSGRRFNVGTCRQEPCAATSALIHQVWRSSRKEAQRRGWWLCSLPLFSSFHLVFSSTSLGCVCTAHTFRRGETPVPSAWVRNSWSLSPSFCVCKRNKPGNGLLLISRYRQVTVVIVSRQVEAPEVLHGETNRGFYGPEVAWLTYAWFGVRKRT